MNITKDQILQAFYSCPKNPGLGEFHYVVYEQPSIFKSYASNPPDMIVCKAIELVFKYNYRSEQWELVFNEINI